MVIYLFDDVWYLWYLRWNNLGLSSVGWLAIEILYVLAAVIRLAYFNVTEETRQQQTTEKRKYYQGLPVTTSAFILPFAFALRYVIFGLDYLYGTLMLITGILFVVDFKVPKLKGKGIIALGVLVVIELVQILCFSWLKIVKDISLKN